MNYIVLKRYLTHGVFLVIGLGVMYGVWLYKDNERMAQELTQCELDTVTALDAQIEAQAEVEALKVNER